MNLRFSIRDLPTRLRRPRFSLRLLLLLITLAGAVFGWRAAVDRESLEKRKGQRAWIEQWIGIYERDLAETKAQMERAGIKAGFVFGDQAILFLWSHKTEYRINKLQQQLAELRD